MWCSETTDGAAADSTGVHHAVSGGGPRRQTETSLHNDGAGQNEIVSRSVWFV